MNDCYLLEKTEKFLFEFQLEASCIAAKETSSDIYDHNLEPQESYTWWETIHYQNSQKFSILGD